MEKHRQVRRDPVIRQRMAVAIDLFETARVIMRQNLRRRHPAADEAEIDRRLAEWCKKRPGATYGDGVGRPVLKDEIDAWLASRRGNRPVLS